jgi:hypothetical protein
VLLFVSCVHHVLLLHGVSCCCCFEFIMLLLLPCVHCVIWCSLCCFVASHFVIGIKIIKTSDESISLSIKSKCETKGPKQERKG